MSSYDDLLDRYVADLKQGRDEVLGWWENLLRAAAPQGDAAAAEASVRARWPLGPVSHPRIVAIYRHYHLECEALNERLQAGTPPPSDAADAGWGQDEPAMEGIIEPAGLLLDSLESRDPELDKFMRRYVFPSIGRDPDGNLA